MVTPPQAPGVVPPLVTPPPQGAISNPPDMSRWNPFGEDNFSRLTEEELLDREFDLLRAGTHTHNHSNTNPLTHHASTDRKSVV